MIRDHRNPFALEPTQGWECALHGHVETEVCHACYAAQQLRVERESYDLRYANTAQAIRRRVQAGGNGHYTLPEDVWLVDGRKWGYDTTREGGLGE